MYKIGKRMFLVALLVYIALYAYKHVLVPKMPQTSEIFQNELKNNVKVSDYKGKFVLVSYFQTWCGDCIREIPNIQSLQESVGKDKLEVLLISDEPWAKISDFKSRRQFVLPIYHSQKSMSDLGIHVFPTTYLLNNEGKLLVSKTEKYDWHNKEIVELINK